MLPVVRISAAFLTGHPVAEGGVTSHRLLLILRIMRLLRVLKILELLKDIEPLHKLLRGIGAAADGVRYVLLLTVLVLYVFAIIATSLLGRAADHDLGVDEPQHRFTSVST